MAPTATPGAAIKHQSQHKQLLALPKLLQVSAALGWILYPRHDPAALVQTPQAQARVEREKGLSMPEAPIPFLSAAALSNGWRKQMYRTHLKVLMCQLSLMEGEGRMDKTKPLCPVHCTPLKCQEAGCARSSQFFPAPISWNRLLHYNWLIHSFSVKHWTSPLLSSGSKRGRNKIHDSESKPGCAAGPVGGEQKELHGHCVQGSCTYTWTCATFSSAVTWSALFSSQSTHLGTVSTLLCEHMQSVHQNREQASQQAHLQGYCVLMLGQAADRTTVSQRPCWQQSPPKAAAGVTAP